MSSYITKAKEKATGEIHEIFCHDDYFGKHEYGYQRCIEGETYMTEKQFRNKYEEVTYETK
jgi:hypothetical protein